MGRIVDKVLGLIGYQEIEAVADEAAAGNDYELIEAEEAYGDAAARRAPARSPQGSARKHARLVNFPGSGGAGYRLVVTDIRAFEDVQRIADHLKGRQAVIANLAGCAPDVAHKVVDFLSGATYALDGRAQKVAQGVYLFAPNNVNVDVAGGMLPWDPVTP